jgi:hypothetical protein
MGGVARMGEVEGRAGTQFQFAPLCRMIPSDGAATTCRGGSSLNPLFWPYAQWHPGQHAPPYTPVRSCWAALSWLSSTRGTSRW